MFFAILRRRDVGRATSRKAPIRLPSLTYSLKALPMPNSACDPEWQKAL
jgi:hypothetical protein